MVSVVVFVVEIIFLKTGHIGQISFQQGLMICIKKFCFKQHAVLNSVASRMYFLWFSKTMILSYELCEIKQNHPSLLLSLNFIIYKTGTMPLNLLQFPQVSMVSRIVKSKFKNQGNVNSSGSCSVRTACHPSYCNDSILALQIANNTFKNSSTQTLLSPQIMPQSLICQILSASESFNFDYAQISQFLVQFTLPNNSTTYDIK